MSYNIKVSGAVTEKTCTCLPKFDDLGIPNKCLPPTRFNHDITVGIKKAHTFFSALFDFKHTQSVPKTRQLYNMIYLCHHVLLFIFLMQKKTGHVPYRDRQKINFPDIRRKTPAIAFKFAIMLF